VSAGAQCRTRVERPHRAATSPASEVREAADVARRFTVAYLRHRRGALSASGIDGASSALREALAAAEGAGESGGLVRRRRVRITELRTELDGDARALACARLLDGRHEAFWLALTLVRTAAGWEVSGVSDR
jgi:hypothetical protein